MDIEFEIQGSIGGLPPELVAEDFLDALIAFVEERGWFFGGGIEREKICGCVYNTPPEMTEEQFTEVFHDFLKRNGWTFAGTISLLIDGEHV